MDHIPIPHNPYQHPLSVPYLAYGSSELAYDGKGLEYFHIRQEVDLEALINGGTGQRSDTEAVCFIQSWLYFGVLVEVMKIVGFEVTVDDFIRYESVANTENVQAFVSTESLSWRLRAWEEKTREMDESECQEKYRLVIEHLRIVSDFLIQLCTSNAAKSFFAPGLIEFSTRDLVALSIMILGEYLTSGSSLFLEGDDHPPEFCWSVLRWLPCLKRRLVQAGWCKSEVNMLADQGLGMSSLYYLSFVNRHPLGRDHGQCKDSEDSKESFRCIYEELKVEEYKTQHAVECLKDTNCKEIFLDQFWKPQISRVVRRYQTPVVTVAEGGQHKDIKVSVISAQEPRKHFQSLSLWRPWTIVPYLAELLFSYFGVMQCNSPLSESSAVKYVCFSHVWADGLGNRKRNALPLCQILRLQRLANNLYDSEDEPVPFWLDTLSVPLKYPLRATAIARMWETYRNADKVLVLDSCMLQESICESEPLQLLMSIRTSGWMRRLWTYHEACLAREIYYQFLDGAIEDNNLIHKIITAQIEDEDYMSPHGHTYTRLDENTDLRLILADSIIYPAWKWLNEQCQLESDIDSEARLSQMLMPLCWRWTSRKSDEAICLSNLLNLPLEKRIEIVESEPSVRMKVLFTILERVPLTILFSDRERYKGEGHGWIPTSLLGGGRSATMLSTLTATVTKAGLKLSRPGIILSGHITTICDNEGIYARDAEGRRFVTIMTQSKDPFDVSKLNSSQTAIILREPMKYPDHISGSMGALVTVSQTEDGNCEHENGELVVQYHNVVKVYSGDEAHGYETPNIIFEQLEESQNWLVR